MKSLVIFFFSLICAIPPSFSIDQKPDLLIIGDDTIMLKSFPLEELAFETRPFMYGKYDFPDMECFRGYQAVWKVINHKLYLAEIIKADESREKVDIVNYFLANNYTPIVINGLIFADWFTMDLRSFPRNLNDWGCVWKCRCPKKQPPAIRFQNGVMTFNRYKGKSNATNV